MAFVSLGALRPLFSPGVWELVFLHKFAMVIPALLGVGYLGVSVILSESMSGQGHGCLTQIPG